MEKPQFEIGQRVHVKSITRKRFVADIVDRLEDDGDWFYSIDRKNYLHEPMLEDATGQEVSHG